MKVLFATAELTPVVRVGGLAEAAAGLVNALRAAGIEVEVVLPDYGGIERADQTTMMHFAASIASWIDIPKSKTLSST